MSKKVPDLKAKDTKSSKNNVTLSNNKIRIIIFAFTLLLYGATVKYDFTLDDDVFFLQHKSVQKGIKGIPEIFSHGSLAKFDGAPGQQPYRPVTLVSFALEKEFLGKKPAPAHAINLLLYLALSIVLFNFIIKLFPRLHPYLAGFIVLLFISHPLHTEVVASVKSRDELLAALFGITALLFALKSAEQSATKIRNLVYSGFFYCMAMGSKESAIAIAAIIPFMIILINKRSWKDGIITAIPFLALGLGFIALRNQIISNSLAASQTSVYQNILYGTNSVSESIATRLEILFYDLKLLLAPWPLSWDYSFNQIPIVGWMALLPWLSILLYGSLIYILIRCWYKIPAIAFGIVFFFLSLLPVSNIFFINGTPLAERFLFLPSLGFVIALVYAITHLLKVDNTNLKGKSHRSMMLSFFILILVYGTLTFVGSSRWKSNQALFESGAEAAPNSSRTNNALATTYRMLGEKERDGAQAMQYMQDAIRYYERSIEILPSNTDALYNLGVARSEKGDTALAIEAYQKTLQYDSHHLIALNNLGVIYGSRSNFDSSTIYLKRSYETDSSSQMASENLALIYFLNKNYTEGIRYGKRTVNIFPNSGKAYGVIRDSYYAQGDSVEGKKYQDLLTKYGR